MVTVRDLRSCVCHEIGYKRDVQYFGAQPETLCHVSVSKNTTDMNPSNLIFIPMPFFVVAQKYNEAPLGCNRHCISSRLGDE